MHNKRERLTVTEANSAEVADVARGEATDTEQLGERHDRRVNQPQAEIGKESVHFHRARELTSGWRRIRKSSATEILHEHLHCLTLVAKEVVELGEHESRNVTSAGVVDRVSE
jgi:hypothetical protein